MSCARLDATAAVESRRAGASDGVAETPRRALHGKCAAQAVTAGGRIGGLAEEIAEAGSRFVVDGEVKLVEPLRGVVILELPLGQRAERAAWRAAKQQNAVADAHLIEGMLRSGQRLGAQHLHAADLRRQRDAVQNVRTRCGFGSGARRSLQRARKLRVRGRTRGKQSKTGSGSGGSADTLLS